jgi:hypothetical protein
MGALECRSAPQALAVRILAAPWPATRNAGRRAAAIREIRHIENRNYPQALRSCFSRWEVQEILLGGRRAVWPELNKQAVRLVAPKEFARRWGGLGVDFKFGSWSWRSGLSLLGFYIKRTDGILKRPLIYVNTAHHPAIVGAALDHEMGHHLTSHIFSSPQTPTHFVTLTGYEAHLADPAELAADILVSFGIYPAGTARALFTEANSPRARAGGLMFEKVLAYIANSYSLRFEASFGTEKKFQALAALLHYTKLRQALLDEYGL